MRWDTEGEKESYLLTNERGRRVWRLSNPNHAGKPGVCLWFIPEERERKRALSAVITSDRFREAGANLATSPRLRYRRVTRSVNKSTSLFKYRAWQGATTRAFGWQTHGLREVPPKYCSNFKSSRECHLRSSIFVDCVGTPPGYMLNTRSR